MDRILIMNFANQCIGYIERHEIDVYTQTLNGVVSSYNSIPPIMRDLAPEPTQFPAANDVLAYYDMKKMDVWEYLKRSNGFKTSRNVWFLAEPPGQIWIPLVIGMQYYRNYPMYMQTGDEIELMVTGRLYVRHHQIDVVPTCLQEYIKDKTKRFTGIRGYVKDLVDKPSIKGLIGRIILEFP